jgi:peptidoglycan/LPS O-acetylase OafA/YrhL
MIAGASFGHFLLYPLFAAPYYNDMRYGSAVAMLGWAWLSGFIAFRHRDHLAAALIVLCLFIAALDGNPSFVHTHWPITLGIVAIAIGFGQRMHGPQWLAATLSLLGDVSYPLYLLHMPIFIVLYGLRLQLTTGGYFLIAIGISAVFDRLYDLPIKRRLTGLAKSKARPIKDQAVPVLP